MTVDRLSLGRAPRRGERGVTGICLRLMFHSELGTSMRVIFLPPQSASQPAPPGGSLFAIDSNVSHDRRQALPGEHRDSGERGVTGICRRLMFHSELGTSMRVIFLPPQSANAASSPKGEPDHPAAFNHSKQKILYSKIRREISGFYNHLSNLISCFLFLRDIFYIFYEFIKI